MKLYQWNSSEGKFTPGAAPDHMPPGDRVLLMSLQMNKGEQVSGGASSSEQLICLLKGAWRMRIAGSQLIVRRNEAVVIPPGVEHSAEAIQDSFALQVTREEQE